MIPIRRRDRGRTYHVLPHVLLSLVVPWLLWPPAPPGPGVLFSPGTPWWTVGIDCSVSGQCPDPSGDTRFRLPAVATVAGLTSAGRTYKINSTVNCLRTAAKVCLHVPTPSPSLSKFNICVNGDRPFDRQNGFQIHSAHQRWHNVNFKGDGDSMGTCKFDVTSNYISSTVTMTVRMGPVSFTTTCSSKGLVHLKRLLQVQTSTLSNKKVLLRERKRHTARRVAIARNCYSGGGGSLDKNFFPQSEHVSSRIWCQKFIPLLGGGGRSLDKKSFSQSEHVSSRIWCQKFFPLLGGGGGRGPLAKIFFPVWTCIKPNLVSKIFPFTGGGSLNKNFFSQSEHVSSQIWCQKFFPLLRLGTPPQNLRLGTPPKIWDWVPPQKSETRYPPQKSETGDPPPHLDLNLGPLPPEQTHTCENITSRRTYVRGR